jgi:hypothetical protein
MPSHEHCWHMVNQRKGRCCWCGIEIMDVLPGQELGGEWEAKRHGPYTSEVIFCPSMIMNAEIAAP